MEVSALKYHGYAGTGLHGRSPLLRLQSDERLITLLRRGNTAAFEVLVSRYESRLLAFCRHLLGSREDAEDVLQEVMAAAFNAIVADERPINVRPWLYRIARNRSLNHLRRTQAIAVDTMDYQLSEHGATTADKVHDREAFRLLVSDIHDLPETQKTALVLREMDAMSYDQIAEAMETTVSSVKSLLVRARLSLAEAAEARALSCEEVRAGRDRRGTAEAPQPAGQAPSQGLRSLQRVPHAAQAHQQGARGAAAGRAAGRGQEVRVDSFRPLRDGRRRVKCHRGGRRHRGRGGHCGRRRHRGRRRRGRCAGRRGRVLR
jgi:RNA polymerase sigma factor (sigma-70 family)